MSISENSQPAAQSNVPEFSVGDLAQSLKRTLEDVYGHVRVRGELSRVSIPGSGHMYSSLKDDNAVIDAVCWKGNLKKLSVRPEEGLEVIVTGRISSYPKSSKYQLVIESMELAGEGALLKMLEERKKRLAEEGLFGAEAKREVPFLPRSIGVITSPTGAVIRDILHRLADRFPRDVLLWPVLVQGAGAAEQVAAAIDGFQNIQEQGLARPDVLIVARGGGSLEDLMAFNEEVVVRAIAKSDIPVISAVGHETDTTLADYVADLRAPTPTGAAEMAVPVRASCIAQILDNEQRIVSIMNRLVEQGRQRIDGLAARLGDPQRLIEGHIQRSDHAFDKLGLAFGRFLDQKKQAYIGASARLMHPQNRVDAAAQNLVRWREQLDACGQNIFEKPAQRLQQSANLLEAYSYKNILQRGYSVVRDGDGKIIRNPDQLGNGDMIAIEFADEKNLNAHIGGAMESSPVRVQKQKKLAEKKSVKSSDMQTSLFD